eukprot:scaffold482_cov266-Amphora_coffeaeformis.AAC.26
MNAIGRFQKVIPPCHIGRVVRSKRIQTRVGIPFFVDETLHLGLHGVTFCGGTKLTLAQESVPSKTSRRTNVVVVVQRPQQLLEPGRRPLTNFGYFRRGKLILCFGVFCFIGVLVVVSAHDE